MKNLLHVLLLLTSVGLTVELPARSEEPAPKVEADGHASLVKQADELKAKSTATDADGKPMVESSYRTSIQSALSRLQQQIAERDYKNAALTCDSTGGYGVSASFKKMLTDLAVQLRAQIKTAQAEVAAKAKAFLADLPAACSKATTAELEKLSEKLQELQASFNKLYGSYSSELSPSVVSLRENFSAAAAGIKELTNARIAEESGDIAKALESLSRLSSSYSSSSYWQNAKEYEAKIAALRADLSAKVNAVLDAARGAMLKVKTSPEIEAASAEITKQTERLRRALNFDNTLQQQVDSLRNVLAQWSRVLAAEEKGDTTQALAQLATLDSESGYYSGSRQDPKLRGIVADKRMALTKKLLEQPPAQPDDPIVKLVADEMKKADTLEKLLALRARLAALQISSSYASSYRVTTGGQGEIAALLSDLALLEAASGALQSRQFTSYLQAYPVHGPATSHRWKDITRRHHNALKAQIFAVIFDLGKLKPAADDTADQTLMKAADAALDDKEWELALRCLDAYRVCLFGNQTPPATLADQIDSLRNFIAAQNYEKAGELEQAAAFYLRVLQAPAEHTPVAAATKEIARLRKQRPDIFEKLRATPPPPLSKLERALPDQRSAAYPILFQQSFEM